MSTDDSRDDGRDESSPTIEHVGREAIRDFADSRLGEPSNFGEAYDGEGGR